MKKIMETITIIFFTLFFITPPFLENFTVYPLGDIPTLFENISSLLNNLIFLDFLKK
jgi:hypothetical protein